MKMFCPHCGVKGSADDSYLGRMIRCPKCKETFRCQTDSDLIGIPGIEEPVPASAEEPLVPSPVAEPDLEESFDEAAQGAEDLLAPVEQEEAAQLETVITETLVHLEEPEDIDFAEEDPKAEPEELRQAEDEKGEERGAEDTQDLVEREVDIAPIEEIEEETVGHAVPPEVEVSEYQSPSETEESAVEKTQGKEQPLQPESDTSTSAIMPEATHEDVAGVERSETTEQPPEMPTQDIRPGKFLQGVQPRTEFSLGEALNEAWQYTKGAKGSIWAAVGVMYLIMLILGLGLGFLQATVGLDADSAAGIWAEIGVQSLVSALSTLFTAGLMYMGVCRAAERSLTWKMVFDGFSMAFKLIIASILMTLLIASGFVLLILPGIYLAVGYTMTLPLMLDQQLDPWQAMEMSRKAIHKVWWKVFGLFFIMGLLYIVSSIPLGIGLIWTVPMSVILVGVVYRYLFGVKAGKS